MRRCAVRSAPCSSGSAAGEVYADLVAKAGLSVSPRAGWLLLRVGEHQGESRAALARCLSISVADLSGRMTDLVQAGYVDPGADGADELTESGQSAYARILDCRRGPDRHPARRLASRAAPPAA